MVTIPLQPIPAQRLQIVLGGQNCTFRLFWRWGRLYLDCSVDADVAFVSQLCLDSVAIPPFPSRIFSGKLYFLDTNGNAAPEWQGLGTRWQLCYLEEGETLEAADNG